MPSVLSTVVLVAGIAEAFLFKRDAATFQNINYAAGDAVVTPAPRWNGGQQWRRAAMAASSSSSVSPSGGKTYSPLGCYTEASNTRALNDYPAYVASNMTVEICSSYCSQYSPVYFGIEYGTECYCGNTLQSGSVAAPASDCSFSCPGNPSEACGAGNRLNVYQYAGTTPSSSVSTPTSTTMSTSSALVSSSTSTTVSSVISSSSLAPAASSAGSSSSTTASQSSTARVSTATSAFSSSTGTTSSSAASSSAAIKDGQCYTEATNTRALNDYPRLVDNAMTVELCRSYCSEMPSVLFGVEYGTECYCGNSLQAGAVVAPSSDCNFACAGNSSETCGAGNRLNVYRTSPTAVSSSSSRLSTSSSSSSSSSVAPSLTSKTSSVSSTTSTASTSGSTIVSGNCYTEATNSRALNDYPGVSNDYMSVRICRAYCAQFPSKLFGVEYGRECYCGDTLQAGSVSAPLSDCSFTCVGNSSETCGAGNRLNVYQAVVGASGSTSSPVTGSSTSSPISSSSMASSSATRTATTTSSSSATSPTASLYSPFGCYTDNTGARALTDYPRMDNSMMTIEMCNAYCATFPAKFAGVEYGSECYCGDSLMGGSMQAPSSDCSFTCPGNASESCGAGDRLSLSQLTSSANRSSTSTSSMSSTTIRLSSSSTSITPVSSTTSVPTSSIASATSPLPSSSATSARSSSSLSSTSTSTNGTSTTQASATSSPSIVACPASNGTRYTATSGRIYLVECYNDHSDSDLSSVVVDTYAKCFEACDSTSGCVAFSWVPQSGGNGFSAPCYLKSGIGANQANTNVWGGSLVATTSTSSTASSMLTTSASSSFRTSSSANSTMPLTTSSTVLSTSSALSSSSTVTMTSSTGGTACTSTSTVITTSTAVTTSTVLVTRTA